MRAGDLAKIGDDTIIESFVKEGEFYTGEKEATKKRAGKVLAMFLQLLVDELYDAKHGRSRMVRHFDQRLENLRSEIGLLPDRVAKSIELELGPHPRAMLARQTDPATYSDARPYFDSDQDTLREVAMLLQQLKAERDEGGSQKRGEEAIVRTVILTRAQRQTLGALAVAPIPMTQEEVAKLASKDWKRHLPFLIRHDCLKKDKDGRLRVPRAVKNRLLADDDEQRTFHQAWVDILEPLKGYTDTAVFLALSHIQLMRFDDAVLTLTNVAEGLESGHTNNWYHSILSNFTTERFLRNEQKITYKAFG